MKKIGDTAGGWAVRGSVQILRAPRGGWRAGVEHARAASRRRSIGARMTVELVRAGLPVPETVITEDVVEAAAAVDRFGRAVLKPLFTSKGRGMQRLEPSADLPERLTRYARDAGPVLPAALRRAPRARSRRGGAGR